MFLHTPTLCLCWNPFDLLVMDWLILCPLRPSFRVLPRNEEHAAYRDYRFHVRGFWKGCGISRIGAAVLAVPAYG